MKKYILMLSACLLFISSAAFASDDQNSEETQTDKSNNKQETYFYYYKGNKQQLKLNPNYIFVSGTDMNSVQSANLGALISVRSVSDIKEDHTSRQLLKPNNFVEKHPVRYWAEIELSQQYSEKEYLEKIDALKSNSNLIVAPYFDCGGETPLGVSNYFYVKLKTQSDFNTLLEQAAKHKVDLVGYNKFMPLWFTLSTSPTSLDAVKTANLFYETGLFQYASPDFMVDIKSNDISSRQSGMESIPNDPYYPEQWHLNNTGQGGGIAGIDIKAENAWDITLGDGINIAIIDSGFEMDHPDLASNNIGTGYNVNTGGAAVVTGSHGTPCAGIAAAAGDNNEGGSGVAPNSGLISITNSSAGSLLAASSQIANGLNWAWQNGADVISNSWSFGIASCGPDCELLDDAIQNTLNNGRGGLGTVIVFSSGNNNLDGANYPGNSNPSILCVGAIDRCGVRSGKIDIIPESCDPWTGNSPGSSYGAPLDVVAGGKGVLAPDRVGNQGYNPQIAANYPDTDYIFFSGTSSACPIVAGVAALVLSANPNLTVQQVNDVIEQSAQKVRQDIYTYATATGRPNGAWNNELGYGHVNAHQAVLLAQSLIPNCEPNIVHTNTINSGLYEAIYTINSTATIGDNQTVTYHAGEYILLESVFVADADNGSLFVAEIEDCSSNFTGNPTNSLAQQTQDVFYNYEKVETEITSQLLGMPVDATTAFNSLNIKNYPDPFTDQTTIAFDLPEDAEVTLFISDVNGKQIAMLANQRQLLRGSHQFIFDGSPYTAGIYYYTVQTGNHMVTQKMILMK